MAQKLVEIKLDKKRYLQAGINAIIRIETELGRPISELSDNVKLSDLRTMLYAMLVGMDKKLTPEKVGELMDIAIEEHGMDYLSEKITEAMTVSLSQNTPIPSKK